MFTLDTIMRRLLMEKKDILKNLSSNLEIVDNLWRVL